MRAISLAAAVCCIGLGAHASGKITVEAKANIYGVGQSQAPGNAGGELPKAVIPISGGDLCVKFIKVQGSITAGCASSEGCITLNTGESLNDPDGVGGQQSPTSNTGYGSISGINAPGEGYLVGVFVPSGGPSGAAPPSLDFTQGKKTGFKTLAPQLDQTFFVGDGLSGDGDGKKQRFVVPSGAGSLVLGLSDTCDHGHGSPGCYRGSNEGHFRVRYVTSQTPCGAADRLRSASTAAR